MRLHTLLAFIPVKSPEGSALPYTGEVQGVCQPSCELKEHLFPALCGMCCGGNFALAQVEEAQRGEAFRLSRFAQPSGAERPGVTQLPAHIDVPWALAFGKSVGHMQKVFVVFAPVKATTNADASPNPRVQGVRHATSAEKRIWRQAQGLTVREREVSERRAAKKQKVANGWVAGGNGMAAGEEEEEEEEEGVEAQTGEGEEEKGWDWGDWGEDKDDEEENRDEDAEEEEEEVAGE